MMKYFPNTSKTASHDDVINVNILHVIGPFLWEAIGHRWIPLTKKPVARSLDIFFDLRPNK